MRYGNKEDKLIDWVSIRILEAKKDRDDYMESNLVYADYLLDKIDALMRAEEKYNLPGGTTYSAYMKNAIENAKALVQKGRVSSFLGSQLLANLERKLVEAIEIFKKGK
jgi:hypothetical protein